MSPHQERVIAEENELLDKLGKLNAFFGTQIFAGLSSAEQSRLILQSTIMAQYASVLRLRIQAFD